MLPRRQKLSRKSFPAHNAPKTTWRGDSLVIRFSIEKSELPPRFAVVVAKKSYNLSSRRNAIRRIVYKAIRERLHYFSRFTGTKFVVTVQKSDKEPTIALIRAEIEAFLNR